MSKCARSGLKRRAQCANRLEYPAQQLLLKPPFSLSPLQGHPWLAPYTEASITSSSVISLLPHHTAHTRFLDGVCSWTTTSRASGVRGPCRRRPFAAQRRSARVLLQGHLGGDWPAGPQPEGLTQGAPTPRGGLRTRQQRGAHTTTRTSKKKSLTTSFVGYLFQAKPPLFFGKY